MRLVNSVVTSDQALCTLLDRYSCLHFRNMFILTPVFVDSKCVLIIYEVVASVGLHADMNAYSFVMHIYYP